MLNSELCSILGIEYPIFQGVCNRAFNPRGIIAYDNKLREAAGLPIDDELEQRLIREGHANDKG